MFKGTGQQLREAAGALLPVFFIIGVAAYFASKRYDIPSGDSAWSKSIALQSGLGGTYQTLDFMAAIVRRDGADPGIRRLAERLIQHCNGHNFLCEATALFEFVRDRITYRRDPVDVERVQDVRRCLESGVGDCDDKAVMLGALLAAIGIKPRFGLLSNKRDDFSHVFIEASIPGTGWITLDPTPERKPAGWRGQAIYYGHWTIYR